MPASDSSARLLGLHAMRLLGAADPSRVAARFELDREETLDALLDFESVGWAKRTEFATDRVWSLTEPGREENERQLAAELDACGGRDAVAHVHSEFVPLNARFLQAATDWQLHPMPGAPMVANDHSDFRWDDRILERLASIGARLRPLCEELSGVLTRFDGYAARYDGALVRAEGGHGRWVDAIEVDSCHLVWIQLHEDLIATLGIARGRDE